MKSEPAVLKRLGPVPFWRGERKCLDLLSEMYSRAMERAQAAVRRREGANYGIIPRRMACTEAARPHGMSNKC